MIDSYNLYFSKQQRDTEAVISNEEIANQLKKLQRATEELKQMRQGISPLTLLIDSYNLYFSKQQRDTEAGISNEEIANQLKKLQRATEELQKIRQGITPLTLLINTYNLYFRKLQQDSEAVISNEEIANQLKKLQRATEELKKMRQVISPPPLTLMIDSYNLYFCKQGDSEAVISNEEIANQLKKLQRATEELKKMRQGISPLTLLIDSYNLYFSKQQRDSEAVISNEEIANQLKKLQRATEELKQMRQGISPLTLLIDSYNLYFSKQQRDTETGISNEEIANQFKKLQRATKELK